MMTAVGVVVLGVCFFICVVNYSFQKIKYKNLPTEVIEKLNIFNSPGAWLIYSILMAIGVAAMVCIAFLNIVMGFSSIGNSQ